MLKINFISLVDQDLMPIASMTFLFSIQIKVDGPNAIIFQTPNAYLKQERGIQRH
jgi:hypothetical protein